MLETPLKRFLAHMRGVLIALHLLAITLMAMPAPGSGMNRENWQDPTVQGEFHIWTERLNRSGIHVTQPELEDLAWRWAERYSDAREDVLLPFEPYYEYCGTCQSWRMFVAPHRYPTRLHIDVEDQGQWRPVYIERDRNHAWLGSRLDHFRFRSAIFRFGWQAYREDYEQFAHWVATQAFRDFSDATAVRVSLYRYRTPTPAEVREDRRPLGEFVDPVVIEREAQR
jgi:hypothetical protein